jgi:hypothetical protein
MTSTRGNTVPNDQFGDFQTPPELATLCLEKLSIPTDARILEPTCGTGTFLRAAGAIAPDSERIGIEVQPKHAKAAADCGTILTRSVFTTDFNRDVTFSGDGPLFVIGNPPWVTSSELSRMGSDNLPDKRNLKQARGLDALLGSSNFDVCECVILKAMEDFRTHLFTLGMLCKTHVARNVIEHAARESHPITDSAAYRIDAKTWFNADVDACFLVIHSDPNGTRNYVTKLYPKLDADTFTRFGVVNGTLVSDIDLYERVKDADGTCRHTWRSGIKHDAAGVFELRANPTTSGYGDVVDVEDEYLFPLLKGTDVFRGRHTNPQRLVIVPQMAFGENTAHLETDAPKLWKYLTDNADVIDSRKSSIYRNMPRFSVFGHGEYTFAPYKVAVSGMHKEPVFRLITPFNGKPVVLDSTCAFIPFDNGVDAARTWAKLNSPECRDLIESLVFWDAKRPLTKKLLSRLNLDKLPVDEQQIELVARAEAQKRNITWTPQRTSAS